MYIISDNWVVKNLENSIATWNEKLAELWQLVTQTPETFKGGQIWGVIVNINSALVGIGYGLLVLFFAMGVFQSAASFRELQRPEFALRHFLHFALAKVAVGYGMEIMTAIFAICGSVVSAAMGSIGGAVTESAALPAEICLLATKGRPKRQAKNIHQVIISPVEEHSKKPEEARRRIEALMGDVPKIELFARRTPPGWDVWGNEVESDVVLE